MPYVAAAPRRARLAAALRLLVLAPLVAALLAAAPPSVTPAQAATPVARAVIVVGPTEGITPSYIRMARQTAAQLRSLGAVVTEVYSPNATLARVRAAAKGANMLIYLGHGNGFPSPYLRTLYTTKVDGMGLNSVAGRGNYNKHYYGEYYMRTLALAPGAIVILNHACYTPGSSEPGKPLPTLAVARKRVDNYASGFFRAGAIAVFATTGSPGSFIGQLFTTSRSIRTIFWDAPDTRTTYQASLTSARTPGMTGILAPYPRSVYYHSVIGKLASTATAWRATWRP